MKTLAVILHHNTPQYTDVLYELLSPEQFLGNYDLVVVDNDSESSKTSKYATYKLEENIFFGGALNACFEMVMENKEYDSLLFLNSDLIVGNRFVESLRRAAGLLPQMAQDSVTSAGVPNLLDLVSYDVLSPCIIQPEKTQNHWVHMQSWCSNKTRAVRWIDLQCPLISRRFIQHFHDTAFKSTGNYIDPLMIRGWGPDVYFGIICETLGWKTGVCDYVPAVHLGSMTLKAMGNSNEYCRLAEQGMYEFFQKAQLMKEFTEMRKWGETYTYE